jgi:hypothetical protein
MIFYRTTNSSIHAGLSHSHIATHAQPPRLIPIYQRGYRTLLSLLSTFNFALSTASAAILPQLLLRHPSPQQLRLFVAPNQPFSPFCRSCQVPHCTMDASLQHNPPFTAETSRIYCILPLLCTLYSALLLLPTLWRDWQRYATKTPFRPQNRHFLPVLSPSHPISVTPPLPPQQKSEPSRFAF